MTLKNLFSIFGKIDWGQMDPQHSVLGVHSDSRKITKDMVFVAVSGVGADGHEYLQQAVDQGAIGLVVESTENIPQSYKGAVLQVLDSKSSLAELLSHFYAKPEERLISIGVTGTNGKTSTTYLIEAFLNQAQVACGVMGTIDHHFQQKKWPSQLTTPDTPTFYERLRQFSDLGARAYVMEVSSHGLKQRRVPAHFDIAVFTNFTRDHLDYHKTMDDYFLSKQLLFTEQLKPQGDIFAIINADDAKVKNVQIHPQAHRMTIGTSSDCDFSFKIESEKISGITFSVTEKSATHKYQTSLIGKHNIYNIVGAIAVARALGVSHSHCQRALDQFFGIPGRLQRVATAKKRHVFIDYAHTPDALEKVLQSLGSLKGSAQLITVFGCGGDRDPGKRPMMGEVAQKYSDKVVVTSDNPRSEDPLQIIQQILQGMDASHVATDVDREAAFKKALDISKDGDILLIAGKGHEDYQIIGHQILQFSDYDKIKSLLEKLP